MTTRHRESDTDIEALLAADKRERRLFQFSPNMDMGAILQVACLVFLAGAGWTKIESYNDKAVNRADAIEKRQSEQEARTNATLSEVKADVKQNVQQTNDLKAKLDLIDLKLSQQGRR